MIGSVFMLLAVFSGTQAFGIKRMTSKNDWEIGKNWIVLIAIIISIGGALYLKNAKDYENLKAECNAYISEMSPGQIRRVQRDLEYLRDSKGIDSKSN